MSDIVVKMKDGTTREFRHTGRAGGSYTKTVKFEVGFVIIEDEWYNRTAIPTAEVLEVQETPNYAVY